MKKSLVLFFFSASILFNSCSKSQDEIDVSQQVLLDYNGNSFGDGGNGDGQWIAEDFSARELNLFTGLDTTNLTGTTKPDTVVGESSTFPNPFKTGMAMFFNFTGGYGGQVVFKYVIVDSHLSIKQQGTTRIQSTPNSSNLSGPAQGFSYITAEIPAGKYRLYFTLSAASNPHFYQSWGNIQKSDQ